MTEQVNITLNDLRAAGVCKDHKPWLRSHGIDPSRLRVKNGGIPVAELYALGDQSGQIKLLEKKALERLKREEGGLDG